MVREFAFHSLSRISKVCVVLAVLLCSVRSHAQMGTLFDSNQQLSSSFVHQVFQDKLGVMWVPTNNGLNSYDGYRFRRYSIADGLPSDNINCVAQDAKTGVLYVGTVNGLTYRTAQQFSEVYDDNFGVPIRCYIICFAYAPDGTIYVGTSGEGLLRITAPGKVEHIAPNIPDTRYSRSISIDSKGVIWVSTDKKGIIAIKRDKGLDYKEVKRINLNPLGGFALLCHDHRDNLYIGYMNGGIYRNETMIPGSQNVRVNNLTRNKDGNIYVGTDGNGLKLLNTNTCLIENSYIYSNQVRMDHTKVYDAYEDHNGNLWLALYQKGIFMQPSPSPYFHYIGSKQGGNSLIGDACIMTIYKTSNGLLWVATDCDGLYCIKDNVLLHHFTDGPDGQATTILTMMEDREGHLWVGTYTKGFGWIDQQTGAYHRDPLSIDKAKSVFDLRQDCLGRIWVGTLGDGLYCYEPKTGKSQRYGSSDENKNSISNNYILQMDMSPDGKTIFVGTASGLSAVDVMSGNCLKVMGTNKILFGQQIYAIKYTPKNGLWIGTAKGAYHYTSGHGLLVDPQTEKVYTTEDGLPGMHVLSIEADRRGEMWMSTNFGLCHLNAGNKSFDRFFASDGLQGNEYNEGASFTDAQGIMYFGGISGLSYFNPLAVKPQNRQMKVNLMHMQFGNERVRAGIESGYYTVCDTLINDAKRFDFYYDDNTITMDFSTLIYSAHERISFAYSLNGGKDWVTMPPGKNELTLSNMPPGDYDFQVVAIDNGKRSEPKEFLIVIHNAWYFTPLARLLYLLLICAAVMWYINNVKVRNRERLRLKESMHAEELNEQKLQSFINISHEIRTPMTLIVAPLLQLMKEDEDAHRQSAYQVIRRNTERILHLVNQIMDIRKIDKGQMVLQMQPTEMSSFVQDVLETFSMQAVSKSITLDFVKCDVEAWIDRAQMDKILMNLLSNAFKYTPKGGVIRVTLAMDDDEKNLTLSVFDNGEKIPESDIEHIFQRFYQSKTSTNHHSTGTGVGLDLTRSLVLLHHGNIEVHNVEEGVEFLVTLPLGKDHLSEEEIAEWNNADGAPETLKQNDPFCALEDELMHADTEEQNDEEESGPRIVSKRPTIVVVDDDEEIRRYITTELTTTYRVLSYSNGADALPAILREIPQLVVSDVMMPLMDGNTLCAKIKANVNTNHIPVILLTAKTRDEDTLESLETGADLYMTKPFNMDILRRNIANLLSTRKLMQNKFTGKEDQSNQIDAVEIESADEKLLARIMAVINENLGNSDLNIDMLCREVGISRVHLHRKMKEMTNQTPHDFIRNLRMKQAARLLKRKGQSITEVLYHCGFNSSTSFSTMFKKMYGMSPREYQRQFEESSDNKSIS